MPGRAVWIDLENSPHVPFFLPWMTALEERGHEVFATARDLSQTLELLRLHGRPFTPIGDHAGGGRLWKGLRSLDRARRLRTWARSLGRARPGARLALALGHGSRAQALAAASAGIPAWTFVDYEYVSLRLFGLCCRAVFVPDAVSPKVLAARGVPRSKLRLYPGFKEQLYLDPERDRAIPEDPPLILVRPPARLAHYHSEQSEHLYRRLLARLAAEADGARVLLLPRYPSDVEDLRSAAAGRANFQVQAAPLDGAALLQRASLVVSGGGTMVREAAVLSIPAASFFGGPVGGVDRRLAELRRLSLLRTDADVDALALPPFTGAGAGRVEPIAPSAEVRAFLWSALLAQLEGSARSA